MDLSRIFTQEHIDSLRHLSCTFNVRGKKSFGNHREQKFKAKLNMTTKYHSTLMQMQNLKTLRLSVVAEQLDRTEKAMLTRLMVELVRALPGVVTMVFAETCVFLKDELREFFGVRVDKCVFFA